MRAVFLSVVLVSLAGPAAAAARPVTVVMERGGRVLSDDVTIPRFGGGDQTWRGVVACVRDQFAPFQVDLVEAAPARGAYITVLVGGRASSLGYDDQVTSGVAPYTGDVIANAVVHVFSQGGRGERDVASLCAVAAHEIGHALGLDHSTTCGDLMSYHHDRCGAPAFLDVEAPCGTDRPRTCSNGDATQSSYRRLGHLVGFKTVAPSPPAAASPAPPSPAPVPPSAVEDPWDVGGAERGSDDEGGHDDGDDTVGYDDGGHDADDAGAYDAAGLDDEAGFDNAGPDEAGFDEAGTDEGVHDQDGCEASEDQAAPAQHDAPRHDRRWSRRGWARRRF